MWIVFVLMCYVLFKENKTKQYRGTHGPIKTNGLGIDQLCLVFLIFFTTFMAFTL